MPKLAVIPGPTTAAPGPRTLVPVLDAFERKMGGGDSGRGRRAGLGQGEEGGRGDVREHGPRRRRRKPGLALLVPPPVMPFFCGVVFYLAYIVHGDRW